MDDKTLEFWNKCHSEKIGMGLTGTRYDTTIEFLKLNNILKPNMKILEIGVGFGYTLNEFHKNGHEVSAVDVSNIALKCVEKFSKIFTIDQLDDIPSNYYDLVMCNNVIQHIYTSLLIKEFEMVLRSLKDDGIFAMHFVSSADIDGDAGLNCSSNGGESFFRTKEYMKNLIGKLGGECELVYDSIRFYSKDWDKNYNESGYGKIEYSSEWVTIPIPTDKKLITGSHVFHVRKKL